MILKEPHMGKTKNQNKYAVIEPDIFAILSATWILASNDENPIITYDGIKHRLGLSKDFEIKNLIQSRGELFRQGVPQSRLIEWKQEMRARRRLPSWIKDLDSREEQNKAIESLSVDKVFRSQFRAEKNAPRSPIQIVDWGLQHIERLRKANIEKQESTARNWQIGLVFAVGIISILADIIVVLLKLKP